MATVLTYPALDAAPVAALHKPETPFVAVDRRKLDANIATAAAIARAGGVAIRPHIKTHKSLVIARWQIAAGAVGITSAKSEEAETFLRGGISSVTLAHPLVDSVKITRLLTAARTSGGEVRFIADCPTGIDAIGASARQSGLTAPVFLKVDVGLGRCGVDPAGDAGVQLARLIAGTSGLQFAGLLSHAGHAYGAGTPAGIRSTARAERTAMTKLAERIRRTGLDVPAISVGSTPTLLANDGFDGLTEIRPGNYVFLDLTQVALGIATLADVALSVVATIVSCNRTHAIVDAGSKVLSSDRGPHGSDALTGFGLAFPLGAPEGSAGMAVAKLSEEHGFIAHGGKPPGIGTRLRIFPNHSCVVANLARTLWVYDSDGQLDELAVDARACVH